MKEVIDFPLAVTGESRASKSKIKIHKYVTTKILGGYDYRKNITIEDIIEGIQLAINTGRLLDSDEISQMGWIEEQVPVGFMSLDEPPKNLWSFAIQVLRYIDETDDEFLKRHQELQKEEERKAKEEHELYLRLKAKYDKGI